MQVGDKILCKKDTYWNNILYYEKGKHYKIHTIELDINYDFWGYFVDNGEEPTNPIGLIFPIKYAGNGTYLFEEHFYNHVEERKNKLKTIL